MAVVCLSVHAGKPRKIREHGREAIRGKWLTAARVTYHHLRRRASILLRGGGVSEELNL